MMRLQNWCSCLKSTFFSIQNNIYEQTEDHLPSQDYILITNQDISVLEAVIYTNFQIRKTWTSWVRAKSTQVVPKQKSSHASLQTLKTAPNTYTIGSKLCPISLCLHVESDLQKSDILSIKSSIPYSLGLILFPDNSVRISMILIYYMPHLFADSATLPLWISEVWQNMFLKLQ